MKIALVILHADPARGGAERYTVDLAAALAQRGHAVDLLAQTFPAEGVPAGVNAVAMPGARTRTLNYRRFLRGIDARIDQVRYDIVHAMLPVRRCDIYHPHAGMAAEQMAKSNRLLNPRRMYMARVERRLLADDARGPIVLSLSEYVKKSIRRHYPLPDDRLVTLFNAVDLRKFDPQARAGAAIRQRFGIDPQDVIGLFVGHDFKRKGLMRIVCALPKLDDPSLQILVLGQDNFAPYAHRAEGAGVRGRLIHAGPSGDAFSFYKSADFLVLPTVHDPCSLVVLEALAMGLPVISTVFNGATEIMTDGVHGFILNDPNDIDALAEAMRRMTDTETRARMSRACLDLRPRLSYEAHVDRLLGIYQRALTVRQDF